MTLTSPSVRFDLVGRGTRQPLGWIGGGRAAGFLALDRNRNGTIDSGRELFGNFTPLGFANEGERAGDGFAALRWFDDPAHGGNGDGQLDERDAVFSRLLVWLDANANGVSEPEELVTMAEAGIVSIDVTPEKICEVDECGNELTLKASFVVSDPKGRKITRWAYDVFLSTCDDSDVHGAKSMNRVATSLVHVVTSVAMLAVPRAGGANQ